MMQPAAIAIFLSESGWFGEKVQIEVDTKKYQKKKTWLEKR